MVEYRRSAHAVFDIKCNVVWITKYRYKVLKGRVVERTRDLIRQICEARDVVIVPGAVSPDHVHMLLSAPPDLSPSKLVQYIKGRSSRKLQDEFPELRNGGPLEVTSTAFRTQPPNLQPVLLMDRDFAIIGPLVRHRMPRIRFLYIGSCVCYTLLTKPASRRHLCASLSLHLHQACETDFHLQAVEHARHTNENGQPFG